MTNYVHKPTEETEKTLIAHERRHRQQLETAALEKRRPQRPNVRSGDWIILGAVPFSKDAVVCTVYGITSDNDIEVIYLDYQGRAINEDMVWNKDRWESKSANLTRGYADNFDRLSKCVTQLRRGRW